MPYWLLLALSVASATVGGWLVWDNATTMQTTLLDGTATNVEVYVGQAWITAGAAILGAGVLGVLLALVLAAAKSLIPAAPVVVEPIDWTADDEAPASDDAMEPAPDAAEAPTDGDDAPEDGSEDQNGSSGSIATARKISVK
ncbi:hypothetical protein KEC56_10125 [Microbacterium sp. YMB-B2]|uniref:Dinucleotide-utilizing enzyme n=1 Tax=Microbacterium tenebrionis TaxID=2830665 RepID=A0A9X1LQD6_9MICO|nr:hypothetical protein [Microbacterium tenebrionis]